MQFYVPPTLKNDFDTFLLSPACHNIKYCHNVLSAEPVWYEERAEVTIYSSKQRTYDKALKLTLSYNTGVQKGDIIEYDEKLFIVTLNINNNQLNAKSSVMEQLGPLLTFLRKTNDKIDEDTGLYLSKEGYENACPSMRCIITASGQNSYLLGVNQAGLFSKNDVTLYTQANPAAMSLKRDDVFHFHSDTFIIRSVLFQELNYDDSSGVLILQAENSVKGNQS